MKFLFVYYDAEKYKRIWNVGRFVAYFNYIILTDLIVKGEYTLTYQTKVLVYIPNISI